MFYSHHLLARKAPLGQIWRAATLHAKINRKNLNKLNIINICEEILNPSVPMALRLSGILMGGVVIVYERKVKLLFEDVTRLLVELNEAWKVKATQDPTVLPKGKSQAKYEAVTIPDDHTVDLEDMEQPSIFSNSDPLMGIHKSAYTEMNFDNIDDSYINHNQGEADLPHDHHQADIENITIFERFDSHQADAGLFNKFERFDIEGDNFEGEKETQEKFPSYNNTDLPDTLMASPPLQDEPHNPDEIHQQHPEDLLNHQDDDKAQHSPHMQRPSRKRARQVKAPVMDYEQTLIPGPMYQSWLQDTSDIVSRGGRKQKHLGSMHSIKIDRLMDLPPVALVCGLFTDGNTDIYYPLPLLKQWMKCTQTLHDSPSGETVPPHPPAPLSSPPPAPETNSYHDPTTFPFEDHYSGAGSESFGVSIEKPMPHVNDHEMPTVAEANGGTVAEVDVAVTPTNSVDGIKSISSASGHKFEPHRSDVNSGRFNKKRLFSSLKRSGGSLEPVAEDFFMDHPDPNFKLAELSENELAPENDLLVETGPTQTQKVQVPDQPTEHLTDSICLQLKTHFDTPGAAQTESLNQLALGMDRKKAACLFYHTCVLVSRDIIRVQQKEPYGNILISRGIRM